MEQREPNVEARATTLISEFVKKFRAIDFTLHPCDIPGEAAGKGSNVGWAARKLSEKYSMGVRKDVIITGIDGTCARPAAAAANSVAVLFSSMSAHPRVWKGGR